MELPPPRDTQHLPSACTRGCPLDRAAPHPPSAGIWSWSKCPSGGVTCPLTSSPGRDIDCLVRSHTLLILPHPHRPTAGGPLSQLVWHFSPLPSTPKMTPRRHKTCREGAGNQGAGTSTGSSRRFPNPAPQGVAGRSRLILPRDALLSHRLNFSGGRARSVGGTFFPGDV